MAHCLPMQARKPNLDEEYEEFYPSQNVTQQDARAEKI